MKKTGLYLLPFLCAVAIIFTIVEYAAADIYKWVDKDGGVHFTDRISNIPDEYRNQIKNYKTESAEDNPSATRHDAPMSEFTKKRPLISGGGGRTTIKDPTVAAKLKISNNIGETVKNRCTGNKRTITDIDAFNKCMCNSLPELLRAQEITSNALLDLAERRPELRNKWVTIEDTQPRMSVHLDITKLKQGLPPDFFKTLYKCN